MRKLYVLIAVLLALGMVLSACQQPAAPAEAPQPEVPAEPGTTAPEATEPETTAPAVEFKSKDPETLYLAYGDLSVDTLDPALAYDTMSGEMLQNVYETLIFYDGESLSEFVPKLAAEMPTVSEDGTVFTFKIRENVKFHNGDVLTPTDVAYSFQRGLLQGGTSSPQLLLTEPFLGVGIDDVSLLVDPEGNLYDDQAGIAAADPAVLMEACQKVQNAIVADDAAGTVTMTLAQPWGPFISTIANNWGSIMDKKWVVENGGWDGTCETWQNYYGVSSADDPFSVMANGTGPFKIDKFVNQDEIVLVRNEDYWREPAKLAKVVFKQVPEWGTRFAMLQTGDVDVADVPAANRSQMDALVGEISEYDPETDTYGPLMQVCDYDGSKLGAEKFVLCEEGQTSTNPFVVRIGRPRLGSVLRGQLRRRLGVDVRNRHKGRSGVGGDGGGMNARDAARAKKPDFAGELTKDQLLRLSAVIGIYKSLELYFSEPLARSWFTRPNTGPLFGGSRPVDTAIDGGLPQILAVRTYLDALRGGA